MEIVQLGSLYLNGEVRTPGTVKGVFETPFIGDTVGGHEIQWVKDGERLIADRCIVQNITWNDLDVFGFIFGCPVLIDGKRYLCRSLKGGALPETHNEWDDLMKRHGGKESLWHWQRVYFWCQEEHSSNPTFRMLRKMSQQESAYGTKGVANSLIGFRPVLEPGKCVKDQDLSHALRGSVKLWFPFGPVEGTLTDYSDYDITIRTEQRLPEANSNVCRNDDEIVISRTGPIWMTNN